MIVVFIVLCVAALGLAGLYFVVGAGGTPDDTSGSGGSPPVLASGEYPRNEEGFIKEEAIPPPEKIMKALRSDKPEWVIQGLFLFTEVPHWPAGLSKKKVRQQVRRHLKSENMKNVRAALLVLEPKLSRSLSDVYFQTDEDIRVVREAIDRWNATQDEESGNYLYFKLVVDEQGNPISISGRSGHRTP